MRAEEGRRRGGGEEGRRGGRGEGGEGEGNTSENFAISIYESSAYMKV